MAQRMVMPVPERVIGQKPRHFRIRGRHMAQDPWVVVAVLVVGGEIGIGIACGEILIRRLGRVCGHIGAAKAALATHLCECRMARGVMVDLRPIMLDQACRNQFHTRRDFQAFARPCAATLGFALAVAPVRLTFKRCGSVNRPMRKERQTIAMPVKGFERPVIQPRLSRKICGRAAAQRGVDLPFGPSHVRRHAKIPPIDPDPVRLAQIADQPLHAAIPAMDQQEFIQIQPCQPVAILDMACRGQQIGELILRPFACGVAGKGR